MQFAAEGNEAVRRHGVPGPLKGGEGGGKGAAKGRSGTGALRRRESIAGAPPECAAGLPRRSQRRAGAVWTAS